MACPRGQTLQEKALSRHSAHHGSAPHRHPLPPRQGRRGGGSGSLRLGQDRRAAPAGEVGGGGHHRLHRLRRARQRDDRRAQRVPRAEGPAHGQLPDGAHRADCQHLRHARCGARGVHLHGHHHRRVLPRHGLHRGADGGLHLTLGGGAARDVGTSGGNAR